MKKIVLILLAICLSWCSLAWGQRGYGYGSGSRNPGNYETETERFDRNEGMRYRQQQNDYRLQQIEKQQWEQQRRTEEMEHQRRMNSER
jgi:hypothetical protein